MTIKFHSELQAFSTAEQIKRVMNNDRPRISQTNNGTVIVSSRTEAYEVKPDGEVKGI